MTPRVHPARGSGRALQPSLAMGGAAPAHPGLYGGALALSYCQGHTSVPACPHWSPTAGTTALVHALEKGSGTGRGSDRACLLRFLCSQLSR